VGTEFFNLPIPSSHTLTLGFNQPVTEITIGNRKKMFPERRARPMRKAGNLSAICEPTVQAMLDPQHFTNLYTSMAC
jgi:hypothetical protein